MRRWLTPYEREVRRVWSRTLLDLLGVITAFLVLLLAAGSPAFRALFRELPIFLFIPLFVCTMIIFVKLFEYVTTVILRRLR